MENKKKNCSSIKHGEVEANSYCVECKLYMCNKCLNFHSELFQNHHIYNTDKDLNEIFTGICKEKDHFNNLNYFCKTHNKLCCVACISKIKGKGNGQHKDCEVCFIEEIKEEKKNKLNENIKYLSDLSASFEKSVNELKNILKEMDEKKEIIKNDIQKTFTKIRNALNDKEDELLLQVDENFEKLLIKSENYKGSEKLSNKIKISLEKGKLIDKEWNDDNKLNSLINDFINIESNLNEIKIINENIKNYKSNKNIEFKIHINEDKINKVLETIKSFGKKDNFHWINNEVNIVSNSKFLQGFQSNIMLQNNNSYSLTDGNKDHYIEFSFIKKYFLKSIRIKVHDYECSLKTFKIELISENGDRNNLGTFIRKKYKDEKGFQEFEIQKECKGIKLYLIDNWGKGGGNYILIKNIDFNVSD